MTDNSIIGLILLFEKNHGNLSLLLPLALKISFCEAFKLWSFFVSEQLFFHWVHSPRETICVTAEKLLFRMTEWSNFLT